MPVILRTFRRFDVRRFSKNLFPLGLHCQRVPKAVVRIFGQSLFFRYLVESPGTPKIVKRIRRQARIGKINNKSIDIHYILKPYTFIIAHAGIKTLTVKCGQDASSVGSSSSGSKSGLSLGGSVLKRLHAIYKIKIILGIREQNMSFNL